MDVYIMQLLRQICFFLDNIVYSLIEKCFQIIIYLANIDFMQLEGVQDIVNRIYLLLGIFMLFKVSFSFLQYLIDPASFSDSSKGFGKLLTNTIVALVLLVSTPFIFDELYKFQSIIIKSNVISNLILGNALVDEAGSKHTTAIDQTETIAKDIQFAMFGAFYTINYDQTSGLPTCAPSDQYPNANIFGSRDMVNACLDDIAAEMEQELQRNGGGALQDLFKYIDNGKVVDNRNFAVLGNLLWWKKGGGPTEFVINYLPLVSTLTGGYLLLLLITFCIDIAARAIKLMFLQMVAPISIISYIDPKESISNGKLSGWIKEVSKTYFSLFLRLAVIFLAVSLVSILISALFSAITSSNNIYQDPSLKPAPTSGLNIFIFIFLILGVFTFAKQVPQLIESVFGIKMSGEMSLNPLKSIRENAGATALIGGAAGLGTSAIAGGAYLGRKAVNTGKNIKSIATNESLSTADKARGIGRSVASFGRGGLSALTQTAFGTLRGGAAGVRTQGKGGYFRAGSRAGGGDAAWNLRESEESRLTDRIKNRYQEYTLSPTDAYTNKKATETRKRATDIVADMKERAIKEANKDGGAHYNLGNAAQLRGTQAALAQAKEALKYGGSQEAVDSAQKAFDAEVAIYQRHLEQQVTGRDRFGNATKFYDKDFDDLTALSRSASELPGIDGGVVNSVERAKAFSKAASAAEAELDNRRDTHAASDLNSDHEQRGRRYWRDNNRRGL